MRDRLALVEQQGALLGPGAGGFERGVRVVGWGGTGVAVADHGLLLAVGVWVDGARCAWSRTGARVVVAEMPGMQCGKPSRRRSGACRR
jgi:hypothetical protein